jgi:arabinogalactan oligomer/maltooligosaccharide transport system substrate-binding protein
MAAPRPRRRPATLLATLLAAGLAACGSPLPPHQGHPPRELRGVVVLAMGVPSDETIDTELMEALKGRLTMTLREFHLIHPRAQVELQLYPEEHLPREVRLRTAAGTAPDLLFVNDSTAARLHRLGLTRPVPMPDDLRQGLDQSAVRRFETAPGEVSSLPVLLLPQLACFDQRRLTRAPTDLDGLLRLAEGGLRVGLPLDGFNLAWTFGSLGVAQSVEDLFAGLPATPPRRRALERWLVWLKEANAIPELTFQISQSQLVEELGQGQLDWTSCRSTHLARLREDLGPHLGVAPLPAGPGGLPTPLSRQRVLAFGRNSTPAQQEVAQSFARFVVTPLTQRNLALQREEVMPVIESLKLPPGRKGTLRLLALAQAQGKKTQQASKGMFQNGDQHGEAIGQVVSRYLFGELDEEGAIEALVRTIQSKPPTHD